MTTRPAPREKALRKQYAKMVSQRRRRAARQVKTSALGRIQTLGYSEAELNAAPREAVEMSFGCGNPAALAELRPGEVVLDLGPGAGLDAFIAARQVGPTGRVIGVDVTPQMVEKARQLAARGKYPNVAFCEGAIEHLPLADESVDVILSNCVLNHAANKVAVFREARRVLRPGGRLCIADLVVEGASPPGTPGLEVWAEWLRVACGKRAYLEALAQAGFRDATVVGEAAYSGEALVPALAGKILALRLKATKG